MSILKSIWKFLSTTLVLLIVMTALFLVGFRLFGLQPYTVLSGSMEPTYPVGSLLYVKKTAPESVQVGQPITFVLNEDLLVATHRVERIDTDHQYFYTKGDANAYSDGAPVHFNNLIGVPVFSIPYLGYVASFIQTSAGHYALLAVGAGFLLFLFLPDLLKPWIKRHSPTV